MAHKIKTLAPSMNRNDWDDAVVNAKILMQTARNKFENMNEDDLRRLLARAQFWFGVIYWRRRELQPALTHFRRAEEWGLLEVKCDEQDWLDQYIRLCARKELPDA